MLSSSSVRIVTPTLVGIFTNGNVNVFPLPYTHCAPTFHLLLILYEVLILISCGLSNLSVKAKTSTTNLVSSGRTDSRGYLEGSLPRNEDVNLCFSLGSCGDFEELIPAQQGATANLGEIVVSGIVFHAYHLIPQ